MRQFCATLLLFAASSCLAASNTTIHWLMVDLAPFRLLHGPEQGKGSSDQMEKMLIKLLPQYQHKSRFVSFERRELLHIDNSTLYCSFGILANEKRKKTMELSIPAGVVMHMAMATLSNSPLSQHLKQQLIQQQGAVDLAKLLSEHQFTGLLEQGRSYAPAIEQTLKKPNALLAQRSFTENNPVDLLLAGRVDFLIDYPHRISYLQSGSRQPLLDLEYFPVAGAEQRDATYVGCSKHPKAKEVIQQVNQQLLTLWADPDYQRQMLSWYDDENKQQLQQLIQHIQQHLPATSAKPPQNNSAGNAQSLNH
ncbi:TIGR02285 family protein [Rheinheimera sp.]|uniref:TIGR02285 family protein n=1 Tax=Rheinheimera sp. TaxID=1869214 RepID=UPI0027B8C6BF|nr:TIGR02285 family protein [Rheinheimera sp.]